ncbi:MAG TPA: hypothetical protein DF383_05220 [Deltaproteobacteria bacterium]|nr:hypothetical protein [Deltaproteobacteria bacterium]
MKKCRPLTLWTAVLTVIFLLGTASLQAMPMKFLFFFPGGQGSQEVAQPLLDTFAASLKKASGGKFEANIAYISDKNSGIRYIQTQRPAAGILSWDLFDQYAKTWGAEVLAKTLQLPSGDGSDQFFLIAPKGTVLPNSGKITILSQRPFEAAFVAAKLFPEAKGVEFEIQSTRNPVGELRSIGSGSKSAFVLLDSYEWHNISRLKAAWVAGLGVAAQSAKVPSAPVVTFPGPLSPEERGILAQALAKMGQDSEVQETLRELRLKGFKPASSLL